MPKPTASLWAKVISRPTINTSSAKRGIIHSWDERLQKMSEALEPAETKSAAEQADLVKTLKQLLAAPMKEKSSKEPVDSHFQGLFTGLHTLTAVNSPIRAILNASDQAKINYIMNNSDTEKDLIGYLDELYYHRRLTRIVASAILKSALITNIKPFLKLVNSGGNLSKWSMTTKHIFILQMANKCYYLKDIETAKKLTADCFDTTWTPLLISAELPPNVVYGLGRALLTLDGESQLLKQIDSWNQHTFTINPSTRVIFPLIRAALNTRNNRQSVVLERLIAAGMRCIKSHQGIDYILLSFFDSMNNSDKTLIKKQNSRLDACIKLLQNSNAVALVNSLLDICGDLAPDLARPLLTSLSAYAHKTYDNDDNISVAFMFHKLDACRAII